MAIDYNVQRNNLHTRLLSTKNKAGKVFFSYSFADFYSRFFSSAQGVQDLYNALTTTETSTGDFFLNPKRYNIANFYYSFACDLPFAPEQYCKAIQTKFTGQYVDGKAKLSITDVGGNLNYSLTLEKDYVIPIINKKISPKITGNLSNKVGDVYIDKQSWGEVRFNFIDSGTGKVIQINLELVVNAFKKEKVFAKYTFVKVSDDATAQPEEKENAPKPEDGINWTKVTEDVYKALKKAGHKVKEFAGNFWALLTSDGEPVGENVWECIDNFNEIQQYYPLNKSIGGDYRFQLIDYQYEGRDTKIEFYKDYTALLKFDDNDQVVPGGKGVWSCGKDNNSYYIKWQGGKISQFGGRVGGEVFDTGTKSGTKNGSQTLIEACTSLKPCPTVKQVKSGKAFKLCMKCDEIKKLQNSPLLQRYYFRKLKENNKPEIADGIFGPIMKEAVLEYQTTYGIRTKSGAVTGMIGPKTYESLIKDMENSQSLTQQTQSTRKDQTTTKSQEPTQPKEIPLANQDTEF